MRTLIITDNFSVENVCTDYFEMNVTRIEKKDLASFLSNYSRTISLFNDKNKGEKFFNSNKIIDQIDALDNRKFMSRDEILLVAKNYRDEMTFKFITINGGSLLAPRK